jgi:hypothetical protein
VTSRTVVLLHSPLTGPAAWGQLPDLLQAAGVATTVVSVREDGAPPFAVRYVASAAQQVAAAAPDPGDAVLLVGHSGAGCLLPQVGYARRAARLPVGGYVFLDAGLPRGGVPVSRLGQMDAEEPGFVAELRALLAAGGRFPAWTDDELRAEITDPAARRDLVASLRPRGMDFFTEPLPSMSAGSATGDWPDAPCGVLRTSAGYELAARLAQGRGWPVVRRDLGHFAALADPAGTAEALLELIARL